MYEENPSIMQVPYICNASQWKRVEMQVLFDPIGEPLVFSIDTSELISPEKERLGRWMDKR